MSFDVGAKGNYVRSNGWLLDPPAGRVAFVVGEGSKAYVPLRTWDWVKGGPSPATKVVLLRGDLVWTHMTWPHDGVTWALVMSPRRGLTGWLPEAALDDEHPVNALRDSLDGEVSTKTGVDAKLDVAFNKMSCTNGAYKVQNWLRGYVRPDGTETRSGQVLKKLSGSALADALRQEALKKHGKVAFYTHKGGERVVDPNKPARTPMWPGDLVLLSRNRYWNERTKQLELVPYKKAIWHPFDLDVPNPSFFTYGWSGHVMTMTGFKTDKAGDYSIISTLEGHMGGTRGQETEGDVYSVDMIVYRGIAHWGLIPLPAKRLPSSDKGRKAVWEGVRAAWRDKYWFFHFEEGEKTRAQDLFADECRRRKVEVRDPYVLKPSVDSVFTSGLECFGFGYWKD